MKIAIMCGGRGQRLGKLTDHVPKPLVKFNNRTILELIIEKYQQLGFYDFIFCIGYKGNMIREVVRNRISGINAEFVDAGKEAGILERLYNAKDLFEDKVLMAYGDTLADIELNQFIEKHENSDHEVTIVVAPIQSPFGLVEYDQNNKVTYFKEKPVLKYYIGYAIINKSAFDLVSSKVIRMPDGDGLITFFQGLININKLGAFYHSGLQITFNTQKDLKLAEEDLSNFYTVREKVNGNE